MKYTLDQMQYLFQNEPDAAPVNVSGDVMKEWLLDNRSIVIDGKNYKIRFEHVGEHVYSAKLNYSWSDRKDKHVCHDSSQCPKSGHGKD